MKQFFICMFLLLIFLHNSYGTGEKEQGEKEDIIQQELSEEDSMEEITVPSNMKEWVEILGLGVRIGIAAVCGSKVRVESGWEYIHGIGWDALPDQQGLVLHFYQEGDVPLISFMLIPHQNLFKKDDPFSTAIVPVESFYTVTEHAIVFGPLYRKNSVNNRELIDKINEIVSYTVFRKVHNEKQSEKTEAPIPDSLQIISLSVFPCYMLIDVALPGSIVPDDNVLLALSGNRMIRLSLIPDTGAIIKRWISPPPGKELFPDKEDIRKVIRKEMEAFLDNAQKNSIDPSREDMRLDVYNTIMNRSEKIFVDADEKKSYVKLILRLLALDQSFGYSHGLDYGEMFPDYEPKTSPDTFLDYRPSLWEIFNQFPESSLENLVLLITLHDTYKEEVKKNPGTWQQGNMILGAPENEYIPSDQELILCEIDTRIIRIITETEKLTLRKYYSENNLSGRELILVSIEIRHADVMGSGRFFYAGELKTQQLQME